MVVCVFGYLLEGFGEFVDGYFESLSEICLGSEGYVLRSWFEEGFSLCFIFGGMIFVVMWDLCSEVDFCLVYW